MAYNDVSQWLWNFAINTIDKYNMDESHGIKHFLNVRNYTRDILTDYTHVSILPQFTKTEEVDLLLDIAFAHDLIDSKYIPSSGLDSLIEIFKENGYTDDKLSIVVQIITTMSYSKRVIRRQMGLPMIDDGPLKLATMIIIDADQLDAYDVERCRIYQETKFNKKEYLDLDESERMRLSRGWQKTILTKRVLAYYDHFMNTNIAKKMALPLHNQVLDYIARELEDAELFTY